MTDYSFGDVILVPFPFTDQTTAKKRPAVVVSSNEYSFNRPDLILMAVTSRVKEPAPYGDTPVASWEEAGLIKTSVMKPIFTTIEKGLVIKRLGKLAEADKRALRALLQEILG
ncbi:MAG TPA: type II toxin-antitoxin system PemK/MazF family toxin [Geobacteraceae bacterium]|nr:type II toxin-antitoxin system PemK/MazF family toxin [Geobacteraceae bacterium]